MLQTVKINESVRKYERTIDKTTAGNSRISKKSTYMPTTKKTNSYKKSLDYVKIAIPHKMHVFSFLGVTKGDNRAKPHSDEDLPHCSKVAIGKRMQERKKTPRLASSSSEEEEEVEN